MKKTLTVPNSLNEISLSQYLEYLDLQEQNLPPEEIDLKMIQIFCKISDADVRTIKATSIFEIAEIIKKMFEAKCSLVTQFKLGDLTFGFEPKLDDLNYGAFLDLNTNISDFKTMYIAMGVLYRPIIKKIGLKYEIEEYKGDRYHDAMHHIPMDAVFGSMVFFWNLGMDLTSTILKSLETTMTTEQMEIMNLANVGGGMPHWMNSVTEMLQESKL